MALLVALPAAANEKIAILVSSDEEAFREAVAGFSEALGKQGVRASYELLDLGGDASRAGAALRKIREGGFRLVFAIGSLATESVLRDDSPVPVISGLVLRPETLKKGKNVTGVSLEIAPDAQLSWIQKLLPDVRNIGVVYNPAENGARVAAAAKAAEKMGLNLETQEVRSAADVLPALERVAKRAQVLWGIPDTVTMTPVMARQILMFSVQSSIPVIGPSVQWVKAGALLSLDCDYKEVGSQCGTMAIRVLSGETPASIPPISPRSLRYSLNMTTARQFKIDFPDHFVQGAKQKF
jgi:putative ABC transport system substrate-binding protein